MQNTVGKIILRFPLKYSMVKAVSFLNPYVTLDKSLAAKRLSTALKTYGDKGLITGLKADNIERQFLKLRSLPSTVEKLKNYDLLSDKRLDHFWADVIKT